MKKFTVENVAELSVGDKVTIVNPTSLGDKYITSKGTIIKITPKTVTVRQYKKRNKGWVVKVGNEQQIIKGWDINPDEYINDHESFEYHEIEGFLFQGNMTTGKIVVMYNGKHVDEFWYYPIRDNKEELVERAIKTYKALSDNYRKAI